MIKKIIAAFMLCFSVAVFADTKMIINTKYYHSNKGCIGKWHYIKSRGVLNYYLKKYGSTYKKAVKANAAILYGRNLFVPYGEKYIKKLQKQGKNIQYCISKTNKLVWPLGKKLTISSSYGLRHGVLHTGIDFPATRGYPIIAVLDGRVKVAKYSSGYGKSVCLEHRNGLVTRYAHMSQIHVEEGMCVKKGQVIGFVGSTGNSTGNHLHFEVIFNKIPLNPIDFLSSFNEDK